MTDNEQKKPIKKNPTWFRCVIIGEKVVFGGLIVLIALRVLLHAIFGDLMDIGYHVDFYICIPYSFPVIVGMFFLHNVLNIQWEEMMPYFIPMFASLVIWWIFLGVVLGTVIYRVRLYMRRKDELNITP